MMLRTTVLNIVNLPIQGPYSESKSNSFNTKRAFSRFSSWSLVSFWSEEKINGCWMFGNWTQSKNWSRLVIAQTQTISYIWSPNTLSHPRRPWGRQWGEGKSKRAGKYGTKKSKERREEPLGTMSYQISSKRSPPYFSARLDFPSPPLSAPGSPRMTLTLQLVDCQAVC